MSLSDKFKQERIKINSEISDEQTIAHCHTTINKIEDAVKEFIKRFRKELAKKGDLELYNKFNKLAGRNL